MLRLSLAVFTVSLMFAGNLAAAEKPILPNILVLVADDMGWADVGYHGSEIQTPNIDGLAKSGIKLERHYVTPMCSSTRACLLSGRYSTRFGLDGATNAQVYPFGMVTLASALQSVGYETYITGKWHLGSKAESGPLQFGFSESHGALAGGVDQYSHLYKNGEYQKTWHRNDQPLEEEGHATDLFAQQAVNWIESSAKTDAPFYLQVAFTAVHVPLQEPDEYIAPYKDSIENESRRRFAACSTHMDSAIGKILDSLDQTGQKENTLVIFTSDNGGSGPWKPRGLYPGTYDACPVLGNNLPLKGRKGTVYEGGIRVPAVVNWPKHLEPGELQQAIHIADWMPTLLDLTGYETEEDLKFDGKNIWPLLTGSDSQPAWRTMYFKRGKSSALTYGPWKLVEHSGKQEPTRELYDLINDPNEKVDVSKAQPVLVEVMAKSLAQQQALDAPPIISTTEKSFLQKVVKNLHWSMLGGMIVVCLFVLGGAADWLVKEAVSLSERSGIPKIIIGATIVSVGTTTPEAAVSVLAALQGKPELALGNAVGSIICDTGLILGIACLISPLPLSGTIVHRQGWLQLLAGLLLIGMSWPLAAPLSVFTDSTTTGNVSQIEGFILLALLGGYMWLTIHWSKGDKSDNMLEDLETDVKTSSPIIVLKLLIAVALVVGSSHVMIPAVTEAAVRISIPQEVIAATIVAFGTSLPELVTAITAVRHGHGDLAIGNVIGADILNVLFVAGAAAAVTPQGLTASSSFFYVFFPAMMFVLIVFRVGVMTSKDTLKRPFGVVLLLAYLIATVASYVATPGALGQH